MHESWCDNESRLSILVRNEIDLLWSLANNAILVVCPIKFVFSCLSDSGWIGSGANRFGFNSVPVISGLGEHQLNNSSGQFGFDSGHIRFWVNSSHYSFESVRFWVTFVGSTPTHVGSGLVSDSSVRVIRFGSLLSGLVTGYQLTSIDQMRLHSETN